MKLTKNLVGQIAACSAIALAAGAANAATYDFTISGDYTAHWQMPSSVISDDSVDADSFVMYDVDGTFSDASTNLADLYFFHGDIGGGLEIHDFYNPTGEAVLLSAVGDQLYTGSEDAPTFNLGTFALTEYDGTGNYTLTVTDVSAVPEPTSYALLLAGLGVVGAVVSRRRKA